MKKNVKILVKKSTTKFDLLNNEKTTHDSSILGHACLVLSYSLTKPELNFTLCGEVQNHMKFTFKIAIQNFNQAKVLARDT